MQGFIMTLVVGAIVVGIITMKAYKRKGKGGGSATEDVKKEKDNKKNKER